jgi:hypothetical protein
MKDERRENRVYRTGGHETDERDMNGDIKSAIGPEGGPSIIELAEGRDVSREELFGTAG